MVSVRECPRSLAIKKHEGLINRLAKHQITKLPANIELSDLIQAARIGVHEALTRFDPSQGVSFETFASNRIKGAMLDFLREGDWALRSHRRNMRRIDAAVEALCHHNGRNPSEGEIASFMGVSCSELREMRLKDHTTKIIHTEDMENDEGLDIPGEDHLEPHAILEEKTRREKLVAAIATLPEQMQRVMEMFYEHDLTLSEIGDELGLTESRICQLHGEALEKLRAKVKVTTRFVKSHSAVNPSLQPDRETSRKQTRRLDPSLQKHPYSDIVTPGFRF